MTIRMSGLMSNMDTDSIVKSLMSAQRTKLTKLENKQTKLTWTQEKWKDLNTKIYKLYTDQVSNMRLQGSYQTLTATSTNDAAVSVTASSTAPTGSQSIVVNQLASSQIYTGAKLTPAVSSSQTSLKTSSKLTTDLGISNGTIINIKSGTGSSAKTINYTVSSSSTIADFTTACQKAGLNASFDATSQRLFVSSKQSGSDNAFSITTSDVTPNATGTAAQTSVYSMFETIVDSTNTTSNVPIPVALKSQMDSYLNAYTVATSDTERNTIVNSIYKSRENYLKGNISDEGAAASPKVTYTADQLETEYTNRYETAPGTDETTIKADLKSQLDTYAANTLSSASTTALDALGLGSNVTKVNAQNSKIVYNGVLFEQSSNTININGLTINAKQVTDPTVITSSTNLSSLTGATVSVTKNTQAIYDKVKSFITDYNSILKEMNTLYYANTAKGYEPLTDDQKESMSDTEIEDWEKKIKDSLLRRDSKLDSLLTGMKGSMSSVVKGVTMKDGTTKNLSLATFGIHTSTDYTEKGLLHIDGNKDDSAYSTDKDKLMAALESDPDSVMQTISGVAKNLYDSMTDKMKSTSLNSALTFYNDKAMTKQQTQYKKDISTLEDKLNDMEDAYYKKFSAMETAMAKLQQSTSALSSFTG